MSLKLDILTIKGNKKSSLNLPGAVFNVTPNPVLMAQAVRVYLSNQRHAHPKTQDRGDVHYSTAKIYRQKGTGRARHGARSAPIFVGGSVAHGPAGNQAYVKKLTVKQRQSALKSALTVKLQAHAITVVDDLDSLAGKSAQLIKALTAMKLDLAKRLLMVLPQSNLALIQAAKNIPRVTTTQAKRLNTYEILTHDHCLFTPESIAQIASHFTAQKKASAPAKKIVTSNQSPRQDN